MDEGEAKIMAKEVEDAEKEMRAAKARLRRLCETKSNGKLKVPAWLHEAWKSGDKGAMAEEKLISILEKSHTKKDMKQNKIEEGWYSKDDMVKVLKWGSKKVEGAIEVCNADPANLVRASRYGGEPEYWVSTRETGSRTQEEKIVEMRKTTSQDGLKR
ncbi:unnamed protein product [Effrenium voratum]|uniref:Uncharacterized protein n=1 Tax=Effrenium voratum TaxID=2562239 RepID=A0AA36HZB9_9DINO|nr:unnamed protein product [Effrenium voratum]